MPGWQGDGTLAGGLGCTPRSRAMSLGALATLHPHASASRAQLLPTPRCHSGSGSTPNALTHSAVYFAA